ncbi:hypothetical protein [Flagellimonas sp.]|uniref:hypothetical protein n=1 Tax=Flagellimonas sp. TaxID=2058762 RepID=UPI003BAA2088
MTQHFGRMTLTPVLDVLFLKHPTYHIVTMSEESIYLSDVLEQMKTLDTKGRAVTFSLKARTLNRNSRTGGKLLEYSKAKLVMPEENPNSNTIESLRTKRKSLSGIRRNPSHYDNKTRNIKLLPGGEIRKIHIRYIIEFNGQKVIY